MPDQLHSARYEFGPIEIDRDEFTALADEVQKDFKIGQVVMTVRAGTEQSRILPDFKILNLSASRAELIKLYVQEPDGGGINRVAFVELGPHK